MASGRVGVTTTVQRESATIRSQSLESIRQWMDQEFQPAKVTVRERSPEGICYRVEQGSPSPTLYLPPDVLDAYRAEEIIAALNHQHALARLRSNPVAQLMCVVSNGRIVVVRRQRWHQPR